MHQRPRSTTVVVTTMDPVVVTTIPGGAYNNRLHAQKKQLSTENFHRKTVRGENLTHDFLDRTTESQNVLCGRATIAVRRPRVTAPSAAAVGRARALPAWRAAALAARRAAGWSRRTPRVTWVLPRRGLKRWRAPTVPPADRRARPRARASPRVATSRRPRLSPSLSSARRAAQHRAGLHP